MHSNAAAAYFCEAAVAFLRTRGGITLPRLCLVTRRLSVFAAPQPVLDHLRRVQRHVRADGVPDQHDARRPLLRGEAKLLDERHLVLNLLLQ